MITSILIYLISILDRSLHHPFAIHLGESLTVVPKPLWPTNIGLVSAPSLCLYIDSWPSLPLSLSLSLSLYIATFSQGMAKLQPWPSCSLGCTHGKYFSLFICIFLLVGKKKSKSKFEEEDDVGREAKKGRNDEKEVWLGFCSGWVYGGSSKYF